MIRHAILTCAVVLAASIASPSQAQRLIYWQGGTGILTDGNYNDGTTSDLFPGATDYLHLGLASTVTLSNGDQAGFGRLRVGHEQNPPGGVGTATLNLTGSGTLVQLTGGMAAPNAAVWVGNSQAGTINIEDGAELKANRLVVVGAGATNQIGTMNIRTGGILTVEDGNLAIADRGEDTGNGSRGVVTLSGSTSKIDILGPGTDMILGNRTRTATYTQTAGTLTINDSIEVGANSTNNNTTLTVSGGTITTGTGTGANAGNFWVGRGQTTNAKANISGESTLITIGNRLILGSGTATGVQFNQSGATVNVDVDLRVADTFTSATSDATYNLSGGTLTTNIPNATSGTVSIVGRQGTGRFIQTGGTANFNSPLIVGSRDGVTTTTANGLYKISQGVLNINAVSPTFTNALSIAPNGTGEFRVVGDDATIDVAGNFLISTTANGPGTLAFELESGDLLSRINVTGNATFGSGSILAFDTTNASPTLTSYDLLVAADIIDNGIALNAPLGWNYQIVPGEGDIGKILQLVQSAQPEFLGDHNKDGIVDAADYVVWRHDPENNGGEIDGYDDFVENFGNEQGGGGSSTQNTSAVPEPATASLLLMIGLLGACRSLARRRR